MSDFKNNIISDELNFDKTEVLEDEYIVEKILDKKKVGGVYKYKVKWEGYDEADCTWEPKENLENVFYLVEEYENLIKKKEKSLKIEKEKKFLNNKTSRNNNNSINNNSSNKDEEENSKSNYNNSDKRINYLGVNFLNRQSNYFFIILLFSKAYYLLFPKLFLLIFFLSFFLLLFFLFLF